MLCFLLNILSWSLQSTNYLNISLKPNEKKVFDLSGFLLVFINSFQYSSDDVIFHHKKNDLISEYKPSNHLAFREGSLEVFSKNGISFQSWLLPSKSCPANNYVVDPSQMTTLQVFFDSVPQFCIFTHFNFPFSALHYDSDYNITSNVMLSQTNWIPILRKKTYSVDQPFILYGQTDGNSLGYASIVYTAGNGKCKITKITEGNQTPANIDIDCQNYLRNFNMWLWGFVILAVFAIILFVLIHFRIINLYKYWTPDRISSNIYANRIEEHLVIEESLENTQIDNTTNESNLQQQQPPQDAL